MPGYSHKCSLQIGNLLTVLGFELRALLAQAGSLPLEPRPQPFLPCLFLEIGSRFLAQLVWTMILEFVLPHIAGLTGTRHCALTLVEMGSHELFAWAGFKTMILPISTS
jgi:hypothetical protein